MPGNELIGDEEFAQVKSVFDSGAVFFAHGFEARRNGSFKVREFEKLLSLKFGANAICCSSGTAALYTALRVLGVQANDFVAIQAYNFIASVEAVVACNAVPVVINVDNSLNMCPIDLCAKMEMYSFKAVIATDMQGNPADFDALKAICSEAKSFLVEDACQAIGGRYKGEYLGTVADIGTFSLDYGKTITTGEGGVIFTKNPGLAAQAMAFVDHGHANLQGIERGDDLALNCGFNFRMSELQAAVGIAQLARLDFIVSSYKLNCNLLSNYLKPKIDHLVEFRKLNDAEALNDGLIFFIPKSVEREVLNSFLGSRGVYFKNVPNAIRWHSVEYWDHVWNNHPIYKDRASRDWQRSVDLLNRAWSFSVNVLDSESQLLDRGQVIKEAVERFA